jgi:hypothetical protein
MSDVPQKPARLARTAKGKRPQYFADPATDKLLTMVVNLMGELSVTRDRLDSVERLLEAHGIVPVAEVDGFRPTQAVEAARDQRRAQMIQRVLRPAEMELEETAPQSENPASA